MLPLNRRNYREDEPTRLEGTPSANIAAAPKAPASAPRVFLESVSDEEQTRLMPSSTFSSAPPAASSSSLPVPSLPRMRPLKQRVHSSRHVPVAPSFPSSGRTPAAARADLRIDPTGGHRRPAPLGIPAAVTSAAALAGAMPPAPASSGQLEAPPTAVTNSGVVVVQSRMSLWWAAALVAAGVFGALAVVFFVRNDGTAAFAAQPSEAPRVDAPMSVPAQAVAAPTIDDTFAAREAMQVALAEPAADKAPEPEAAPSPKPEVRATHRSAAPTTAKVATVRKAPARHAAPAKAASTPRPAKVDAPTVAKESKPATKAVAAPSKPAPKPAKAAKAETKSSDSAGGDDEEAAAAEALAKAQLERSL